MIFITGVTGFLGSRLLRHLLLSGRSVIATKRVTSNLDRISDLIKNPKLFLIDNTPSNIEAEFARNKIEIIIHAATEYGRSETGIAEILNSNLILPIQLAELGIKFGTKVFINVDSYFNKPGSTYSNLQDYSLSKRSLLLWLEKLSERIQVVNIILEHLYGPHDSDTKFVEHVIQTVAIKRRESIELTYGHQKRDFIYIDDAVSAFERIVHFSETHYFTFKVFEVGSGEYVQLREFVKEVSRISRSPTYLDFGALEYRHDEIMASKANIRDLAELGWKPSVKYFTGIQAILLAYHCKVD